MQIFDNFLPNEQFISLRKNLNSDDFMWYFNHNLFEQYDINWHEHVIYDFNNNYFADEINIINPINSFFNFYHLQYARIDSILYSKQRKLAEFRNQPYHKAIMIFYNTDGIIEVNNKKIDMVENRLIFFSDCNYKVSSCSNHKRNLLLSVNYALTHELKYNL